MKKIFIASALAMSMLSTLAADARPDHYRRGHRDGRWDRGHHHRPVHPYPPAHHHRQPVLRYPYQALAWGALLSMFAYHRFQAPPPAMPFACFANSNGFYGTGFGYNDVQAQQNALMSCGPACMDGSYQMNCSRQF